MTEVPENIDDLVAAWHDSPTTETRELHEYLGLTWDEYRAWGAGLVSTDGTILPIEADDRLAYEQLVVDLGRRLTGSGLASMSVEDLRAAFDGEAYPPRHSPELRREEREG